jgi:hypothetical protein
MTSRFAFCLLPMLAVVGCGEPSSYSLAPVRGVVTLDGEPVVNAVVTFQPRSTGQSVAGPGSTARSDASGKFELRTIRDDPGAVVGPHSVTIYPNYAKAGSAGGADSGGRAVIGPDIPRKYNYESTLTFEVPAEGTDSANFELSSHS